MPRQGPLALRGLDPRSGSAAHRGSRQEVADLRIAHLDYQAASKVRLHGKGDKCQRLLSSLGPDGQASGAATCWNAGPPATSPVFVQRHGEPLTAVRDRQHHPTSNAAAWDTLGPAKTPFNPHLFRHNAATHWLESGVEGTTTTARQIARTRQGLDTTNRARRSDAARQDRPYATAASVPTSREVQAALAQSGRSDSVLAWLGLIFSAAR